MSSENKKYYNFNEESFAIITKKALENKKIGKAVRTDEIAAVDDSGWRLSFGDEDKEYMSSPNNISLITLESVLSFEPLLEKVFEEEGYIYIYDEEKGFFTEKK